MARYSEIRAQHAQMKASIANMARGLNKTVDLGDGYSFEIKTVFGNDVTVEYRMFGGASLDINRVPVAVIAKYARIVEKVDDWLADRIQVLPNLVNI